MQGRGSKRARQAGVSSQELTEAIFVAAEVMIEERSAAAGQRHRQRMAWLAYVAVNRLNEDYVQRLSG